MSRRILIVGNAYSQHLINLALKVKQYGEDNIELDIFDTSFNAPSKLRDNVYDRVYFCDRSFPLIMYKLPFLGVLIRRIFDLKRSVGKIGVQYDLINIHYVTLDAYFIWSDLKRLSRTIMLSPWGSDVYRLKKVFYAMVRKLFDNCTYVSVPKIQFRLDVKEIFNVYDDKLIDLGFGSVVIDNILSYENITRDDAKDSLGLKGCFVVTCGYNGYKSQNHVQIIKSIDKVRSQLDENLILILPMTYGATTEYMSEIETLLKEKAIPFRIFRSFLSDEEMVFLRKCSDIFIHAQPTDAFSASVQEYLFTDTRVVNGKWTRYPDLEKFGVPYFLFNSFTELGGVIVEAYRNPTHRVSSELKAFIAKLSWSYKGRRWADFYRSFLQ